MTAEVFTFPGGTPPAEPAEPAPALLPIIEPSVAPEIFGTDLARVHVHGPFSRLVWSAPQVAFECPGESPHNIVMCKIVVPTESLQAIYDALGKAIAARAAVPT